MVDTDTVEFSDSVRSIYHFVKPNYFEIQQLNIASGGIDILQAVPVDVVNYEYK